MQTIIDLKELEEPWIIDPCTSGTPDTRDTGYIIKKNEYSLTIPADRRCCYICLPNTGNTGNKKICVYVCREGTQYYFIEYIESLGIFDVIIKYEDVNGLRSLWPTNSNDDCFYLVSFDLVVRYEPSIPKKCMILNTEQMTIYHRYQIVRLYNDSGYKLIDYSRIHDFYFPDAVYLPYQYSAAEIDKLRSYIPEVCEYDICMVQCNSPERRNIYNQLVARGVKVLEVIGWGDERDKKIANCQFLLNIHFNNTFQIYEHLRCDRWMFAGKTIISEESRDQERLDVYNVHFYEYDEIVSKCIEHIASSPTAKTTREEKEELLNSVVENRRSYLNQFCEKLDS